MRLSKNKASTVMVNKNLGNTWLIRLLRTVNAGASTDSLFRLFSKEVLEEMELWTIQVYYYDRLGNLVIRNWFGISDEELENYKVIPPKAKTPLNDCVRTGETLILTTSEEILEKYPEAMSWPFVPESLACIPLKVGEVVEGVLGFSFRSPLEVSDEDVHEKIIMLHALAEICQLVTFRLTPENEAAFRVEQQIGRRAEEVTRKVIELGERHREILCLISKGFTNHEIAKKMNYSEATTRVEIGKLFARLGVNNRQEAASLAHIYRC